MSSPYATKCWSCGSSNFKECAAFEMCYNCGLECNYHNGKGANAVYNAAHDRLNEQRAEANCEEAKQVYRDMWGEEPPENYGG